MDIILQRLISGLTAGSVYALVAFGYNIIYSTSRVVNFAQGQLLMVGAMCGVLFHVTLGWPLFPAILGVAVVCGALGLVLERTVSVPLKRSSSPFTWIIGTIAAAVVIENVAAIVFGRDPQRMPPMWAGAPFRVGDVTIERHTVAVIAIAIAMMLGLEWFMNRTILGKALRATAHNPAVAPLMGIEVPRLVTFAFVLSAVVAGVGGVLVAPTTFAQVDMGLVLGLKGFIAVVIGGMGSARGALLGGLLLGVLESQVRAGLPQGFGTAALFGLLIAVLLVRPSGLLGKEWGARA